jgi:hypothetical protein
MHAHQCDCVGAGAGEQGREAYHGIPVAIVVNLIVIVKTCFEPDNVLARIETVDRDLANRITGCALGRTKVVFVEYEGILTCADRYRAGRSHINRIVAIADVNGAGDGK